MPRNRKKKRGGVVVGGRVENYQGDIPTFIDDSPLNEDGGSLIELGTPRQMLGAKGEAAVIRESRTEELRADAARKLGRAGLVS